MLMIIPLLQITTQKLTVRFAIPVNTKIKLGNHPVRYVEIQQVLVCVIVTLGKNGIPLRQHVSLALLVNTKIKLAWRLVKYVRRGPSTYTITQILVTTMLLATAWRVHGWCAKHIGSHSDHPVAILKADSRQPARHGLMSGWWGGKIGE